jgi:glycosyltransferase involved in cell wall biosynthesis
MGGLSKSMLLTLQGAGVPTVYYLSDHWIARGLASDVWLRWWNRAEASMTQRFVRTVCEGAGVRRRWNAVAPTNPVQQLRFPRIYFCSRALRELTAAAGFDVNHGAVIYCPVHLRYFQGELQAPRPRLKRLLYVGRLAEDKGVLTALRALALLKGKEHLELSVYGQGDPDYVAQLKRFAEQYELAVTFTAADLEEMPEVYRSHDLLLFTSEWPEPFALTPIEAMACGLPVVGTNTGGSAELFRPGENGLVYAAGNPDQLAERIVQFASDYQLRSQCALTAYCEARQRYAAPVVVDQIEAYLEETGRTWRASALPHWSEARRP